nr:helix-turn-helix domain-containing protein [Kiritimatiellia bacterium]
MTVTPHELASSIRDARTARGLTLKELADLAGIGKTAMFDLEHGNPGVRLNTLLSVLHILNMK